MRIACLLIASIVTGCSSSQKVPVAAPSAASVPTALATPGLPSTGDSALQRDERQLRASSYTPQSHVVSSIGPGRPIVVFHSVCTGSADGHCQAVQAFASGSMAPIWVGHYAGVLGLYASPEGFTVRTVRYAASDPLCCPSLPPRIRRYVWNGHQFVAYRSVKLPIAP